MASFLSPFLKFPRTTLILLGLACLGFLAPHLATAQQNSIMGTWEINLLGQKEVLTLRETDCHMRISGAGLPQRGIEQNKKIAKILPNPTAKRGMVILGPSEHLMKPYEIIFWYNLNSSSVRLLILGEQFASAEEAENKAQGNPKLAKVYRRAEIAFDDCDLLKRGESEGDRLAPAGCQP